MHETEGFAAPEVAIMKERISALNFSDASQGCNVGRWSIDITEKVVLSALRFTGTRQTAQKKNALEPNREGGT